MPSFGYGSNRRSNTAHLDPDAVRRNCRWAVQAAALAGRIRRLAPSVTHKDKHVRGKRIHIYTYIHTYEFCTVVRRMLPRTAVAFSVIAIRRIH